MAVEDTLALFSLAELKLFLAETADDDLITDTTYDTKLERIINTVGAWFNSFTRRVLVQAEHTEYRDGSGSPELYVEHFPIVSTAATIEIYIDAGRDYAESSKVDADEIIIYKEAALLRLEAATFSKGAQSVKIVYTAGYSLSAGAGEYDVPADLVYAGMLCAGMLWKIEKEKIFKINSLTIAGGSVTLESIEAQLPQVKEILEPYVSYVNSGIVW